MQCPECGSTNIRQNGHRKCYLPDFSNVLLGEAIVPHHFVTLGLIVFSLTLAPIAQAADINGNYTPADFNTGTDYALSTWKVVASQLNCRQQPGTTEPVVHTFNQDDPLAAVTSQGSRDNLPDSYYLQADAQGKPWMRVHAPIDSGECFVRASRSYIAPVIEENR